ncbi:hypothetical protein [Kribbella sp. NPDC050470]|uniref:hypothetical protein n=1 Tax=unclassified Kribbella TaxID=2644121 RepID=UPI003795277E
MCRIRCQLFAPSTRAVDPCRVVQRRVDRGQRGQVDDQLEAGFLPDRRPDEQRTEQLRRPHEQDRLTAEQGDEVVDQPRSWREEDVHHPDHHDGGDERGGVEDAADEVAQPALAEVVHHQGQQHRHREGDQQVDHRQRQRVLQNTFELR